MSGELAEFVLMTDNLSAPGSDIDPHAELIARARAGERAAFDQLMTLHQQRVVMLAWRLLGEIGRAHV